MSRINLLSVFLFCGSLSPGRIKSPLPPFSISPCRSTLTGTHPSRSGYCIPSRRTWYSDRRNRELASPEPLLWPLDRSKPPYNWNRTKMQWPIPLWFWTQPAERRSWKFQYTSNNSNFFLTQERISWSKGCVQSWNNLCLKYIIETSRDAKDHV